MDQQLRNEIVGFKNLHIAVTDGITHTHVRVTGENKSITRPGFLADLYIHKRTNSIVISRIDNNHYYTLYKICHIVSQFKFGQ
jgi:hypothetical protein